MGLIDWFLDQEEEHPFATGVAAGALGGGMLVSKMQDSDDYEEAVNDRRPLIAATIGGAMQRIPEPGFLSPKNAKRAKTLLRTSTSLGAEAYEHPGFIGRLVRAIR